MTISDSNWRSVSVCLRDQQRAWMQSKKERKLVNVGKYELLRKGKGENTQRNRVCQGYFVKLPAKKGKK